MTKDKKEYHSFISIQDSKALYGIAILLMVFHHCFCLPSRLSYNYIPVLFSFDFESRIAYLGKLCVAIYAFITGYALAQKINNKTLFISRFIEDIKISIQSLIKLYIKLWIVCLIFIPIGILFFNQSTSIKNLLLAFFVGKWDYNEEWWYVKQYILFLFLFPFLEMFFHYFTNKETRNRTISITIIIFIIILIVQFSGFKFFNFVFQEKYEFTRLYTYIFVLAFSIGKFRIYERISQKLNLSTRFYFLFLFLLILVRWFVIRNPYGGRLDIVLTPLLIFSLVQLIHSAKSKELKILSFLEKFGFYSTYMWLTHTFWIYYYFQDIVLLLLISDLFIVKKAQYDHNKCINRSIDLTNYCSNYLLRVL